MVLLGGPLGISVAPYIRRSPTLYKLFAPLAKVFIDASGYRKMGLRYDDLLIEERSDVKRAVGRLSEREAYDRAWRMRTASHCSVLHKDLPKEQWTTQEQDVRYLTPLVEEAVQEDIERAQWDNMNVTKAKAH